MKLSDLPTIKLPIPFAFAAVAPYIHEVPVDSQIGVTDGAASLTTGFVPDNFTAPGAGGVPPFGNDVNGILFEISGWTRWLNAGGAIFPYDSAFAIEIGGYPAGALCGGTGGFFISRIDDNLSVPGADANWQAFGLGNSGVTAGAYKNANITVGADGRVEGAADGTLPTRTVLTSGSGTYNTPTGARQLRIRMIAGGGGGAALTTNNGATGGTTSFGGITVIGGGGGINAVTSRAGGPGGTGGAGSASFRAQGSDGGIGIATAGNSGGNGGSGPFGGAGQGGKDVVTTGTPGRANTGAGGGGAGSGGGSSAGGGASGEYAELIINAPVATYAYAVGAGGAGGAAGAVAGSDGGSGVIIIDEIY